MDGRMNTADLSQPEQHLLGFGLNYFRSTIDNPGVANQVDQLLTKLGLTDYLDDGQNLTRVTEQLRAEIEEPAVGSAVLICRKGRSDTIAYRNGTAEDGRHWGLVGSGPDAGWAELAARYDDHGAELTLVELVWVQTGGRLWLIRMITSSPRS